MSDNPGDAMQRSERDDRDDAVKAFEDLRRAVEKHGAHLGAEMTIIRKALEVAFEQFEDSQRSPTITQKLNQILEIQVASVEHLTALLETAALKQSPDQYARMFQTIADEAVGSVGQMMDGRNRDFQRTVGNLDDFVRLGRARRMQDRWLWSVGAASFLAGLAVALIFVRTT
jgi:hypothetical protein